MSKGSAAIALLASLMDSCSAHRDAGNHPVGNSPQETLQIDGHEPSQRPIGPSQITGPTGCPDLQMQLVALLLVGLPEHFSSRFFFLFDCVKGGAADIFLKPKHMFASAGCVQGSLRCREAPC